jgi:hypothetical protein
MAYRTSAHDVLGTGSWGAGQAAPTDLALLVRDILAESRTRATHICTVLTPEVATLFEKLIHSSCVFVSCVRSRPGLSLRSALTAITDST